MDAGRQRGQRPRGGGARHHDRRPQHRLGAHARRSSSAYRKSARAGRPRDVARQARLHGADRGRRHARGRLAPRRPDPRLQPHLGHRRAAIHEPARLCLGRSQRADAEEPAAPPAPRATRVQTKDGRPLNPRTMSVEDAIDAGLVFAGTPDDVFDQIRVVPRPCRRLRPPLDDGPGRHDQPRRHGRQPDDVQPGGIAAVGGVGIRLSARFLEL